MASVATARVHPAVTTAHARSTVPDVRMATMTGSMPTGVPMALREAH